MGCWSTCLCWSFVTQPCNVLLNTNMLFVTSHEADWEINGFLLTVSHRAGLQVTWISFTSKSQNTGVVAQYVHSILAVPWRPNKSLWEWSLDGMEPEIPTEVPFSNVFPPQPGVEPIERSEYLGCRFIALGVEGTFSNDMFVHQTHVVGFCFSKGKIQLEYNAARFSSFIDMLRKKCFFEK